MTVQRKEIVGSYLMEEEAMNKVNWLKNEGYRPEEIWIIRDRRGVLEQLGEEPITGEEAGCFGSEETPYSNQNATSSVTSPGSLLTPETKSVAATLIELGIDKEEAYRYEFDVKVGKMLILADPMPTSKHTPEMVNGSRMDRYMENEEPALMLEDDDGKVNGVEPGARASQHVAKGMATGGAGYREEHRYEDTVEHRSMERDSERHVEIDGREKFVDTSEVVVGDSSSVSGGSINRPMPDANIDGSIPLDEQLLTGKPVDVDMEKTEKDFAREEVISLHDQASATNESPTMHRVSTKEQPDAHSGEPNNGKLYAENKTEEDVDKALLFEHGQPFPMEKPYEEDVYDKNVMADGPLHVEEVPGDATATEREKPLFHTDEGVRPTSGLEKEESLVEEDRGPILFEDTLNEIERDKPSMEMEPGMEEPAPIGTEQPGDLYTTEYEEGELNPEDADLNTEGTHTYENETSVLEEENSDLFSSRKKERMNTKRAGLFDKEDDDLFRKR